VKQQKRKESNLMIITTLSTITGIILLAIFGITTPLQSADGKLTPDKVEFTEAPVAITGDNIYVTWWTNKTANDNEEIMFRASTNGGTTFGDKINLSNTTNSDSWKAEIDSDANSVVVTWWETNQTSDTPVARISTDSGQTFGPMLRLATNGTIGEAAEGGTEE
jgi:hypothetical protein